MARRKSLPEDADAGAAWKEYRRAQQQRRASRLGPRTRDILNLKAKGFQVQALTPYQFRIDGVLDLYPTHRRYHDLVHEKRGDYVNPLDIAVKTLRKVKE